MTSSENLGEIAQEFVGRMCQAMEGLEELVAKGSTLVPTNVTTPPDHVVRAFKKRKRVVGTNNPDCLICKKRNLGTCWMTLEICYGCGKRGNKKNKCPRFVHPPWSSRYAGRNIWRHVVSMRSSMLGVAGLANSKGPHRKSVKRLLLTPWRLGGRISWASQFSRPHPYCVKCGRCHFGVCRCVPMYAMSVL